MKKPKFTICYPKDKVESDARGETDGQQKTFYDNLKIALDDLGYENEFIHLKYKVPKTFNGDICFAFHTNTGGQKNTWCVKDSGIFNHWEVDSRAWAGWSEMANSEELFKKSQQVDLNQAREFFDEFSKRYIQKNISKYAQPDVTNKLEVKEPYVFFPGQVLQDSVVKTFAKIEPNVHAVEVPKQLIDCGYNVVFKKHPGPTGRSRKKSILTNHPDIIQFSGSIHEAISNAAGIVCINSGVGFESLLYKKHVFVSGVCDYHWVAHKIYSVDDIKKIPEILKTPVDEEKIIKFVYYMLTEVYVNAVDLNSIKKKIEKVVQSYRENI